MTAIRRTKSNEPHLGDLRRALACNNKVSVRWQSGNWIISRWSGCWGETQCRPGTDERGALCQALRIEREES